MDSNSPLLQYMVREQILEEVNESIKLADGGMIDQEDMLLLRWNSQHGALYVDGAHFKVFFFKKRSYMHISTTLYTYNVHSYIYAFELVEIKL